MGATPAGGEVEKVKEDISDLGEITRINLPGSASVTAVSSDGSKLLVCYQGRDEKMYSRVDAWVIVLKTVLKAPDAATFLAAMRNITAPLDQDLLYG